MKNKLETKTEARLDVLERRLISCEQEIGRLLERLDALESITLESILDDDDIANGT